MGNLDQASQVTDIIGSLMGTASSAKSLMGGGQPASGAGAPIAPTVGQQGQQPLAGLTNSLRYGPASSLAMGGGILGQNILGAKRPLSSLLIQDLMRSL